MKVQKIILHNYIPFMHGGTSKVSVDILENVVPIIGNNGSGKSSLLRMMTVFPPVSSDFETGGYKEMFINHNGSDYVLRSEFQKSKATHSFVKDGEELNLSLNSTAQTSLCESHFGMSNLIRDITNGELNISKLTRSARKDILLACYPSDLTFVLAYHKKIASRLRTVKGNIKMMNVRLQEVSDKLMDEEEYKSLSSLNAELTEFQINIDTTIYRLEQDIDVLKKHVCYNPSLRISDEFESQFNQTNNDLRRSLSDVPNSVLYDPTDPRTKVEILKSTHDMRSNVLSDLKSSIDKLVREINEYEDLANDDINAEIEKTKLEITGIQQSINDASIDTNLPVIRVPDDHNQLLITMNEHVVALHSCDSTFVSSNDLRKLESDLMDVNREGNSLVADSNRYQKNIDLLLEKIKNQKLMAYNSNCTLPCQLKDNFNKSVSDLEKELEELRFVKNKYDKKIQELKEKKAILVSKISPSKQLIQSIEYMERFFNSNIWCQYISETLDEFIEKLNTNAANVYNTISRIFANSRLAQTIEDLQKELKSVRYRLKVLVENKLPTKQLISKGLVDKKTSLKKLQDQFAELDDKQRTIQKDLSKYSNLSNIRSRFETFATESMSKVNSYLITAKIDDLNVLICELRKYKQEAVVKQSEIAVVLKEQSHLRIRLQEEIEPSLKQLVSKQDELTLLESALSPNTGIPHIYMVRFVNSVIRTANEYIEMVWNYDLRYRELSEDKSLDFDLPVILHDKSGVKDASMCSKGEQEILNLSFMLALCVHMDLGTKFPVKLDEADAGMSIANRASFINLLSMLIRQGSIRQLFMVNHDSNTFTSFPNAQIVCLNPLGIAVPSSYNDGVIIER